MPDLSLKIINLKSVDSTNNYAIKLGERGEGEIVVVRAQQQTQGKGRLGRNWVSLKDKGLYVSFLLRPPNPSEEIYFLPLVFALGVVEALGGGLPLKIKFPNDVFVRHKKIAGILLEAKKDKTGLDFVVAGIGLNINSSAQDLPPQATSLFLETNKMYNIDELFQILLAQVIPLYGEFKEGRLRRLLRRVYLYQERSFLKRITLKALKDKEAVHFL